MNGNYRLKTGRLGVTVDNCIIIDRDIRRLSARAGFVGVSSLHCQNKLFMFGIIFCRATPTPPRQQQQQ